MDAALRSLLDWYAQVGVDVPDIAPARPSRKSASKPRTMRDAKPAAAKPTPKPREPAFKPLDAAPIAAKAKTLDELRAAINAYDAGVLSDGARQAVFSRGNPAADLMVIGEAPGRDEDIAGEPFVGRSGQLLDRMLGAIGLGADDVYVTNVINWRPPNNRNPEDHEIEMCRPFLNRHIELAAPKVLLLVGGVSLSAMAGVTGIMKNHGQWQEVNNLPALPIYHPAFLLRRPELKKEAWLDLLELRAKLIG
ncbi:uracil-DNA glycosylase family protein [Litorimonas sp. RW-G-Af-16]|uniref:uracil-DNA glycosylase n=1 Tax=Litorimonas sp. RW-G-Af-16 TaxID=3241168 RepID=UPI00390C5C03